MSASTPAVAERPRWGSREPPAPPSPPRSPSKTVSHDYEGAPSLQGVSMEVPAGEVLCLLGHSGCGKSTTLLRLAAGLERPSAGRIVMDRREMAGPSRFVPPEKRGVGLMFQDYALFPHMTILANVMFGLTSLDRASGETAARAALARVGFRTTPMTIRTHCPGGEQQRVALARAIVPRPSCCDGRAVLGLDKRLRDSVRDETMAVLRETRATAWW